MTPDDWRRVMERKPWQEADLHDLRTRYAALLANIAAHREALGDLDWHDADNDLWKILDEEGFGR